MTILKWLSLLTLGLLWGGPLFAEQSGQQRLKQFVQDVSTFEAVFQQIVLDPQGNLIEQASGRFQLERPGRFRWDYAEPYPQQIVADGRHIWFYDVDLEQVTVKSQQEALAETPATLLSGERVPEDTYTVRDLPADDGRHWVELLPREADSSFQSIILVFDSEGLRQMIMQDSFDQRTRLVFSEVRQNHAFDADTFTFTPPTGVDVVGDVPQ